MSEAIMRPIEHWTNYVPATKLRTIRYQCSHCGRFVGSEAQSCNGCGADLRGPRR